MKDSRLGILFLTIFLDLLGFGLIVPGIAVYAQALTGSEIMVGVIAAVFSLAQFLAGPVLGSLSDKIGRRPILLFTLVTNCLGYFLLTQSQFVWLFIISRIICGFSSGNISVAQAYISDITTPEKRTQAMGMIGAAFGMGFVLGPPLGGFIEANYGFLSIGYFAGAACFINLVLGYFFLKESNVNMNPDSEIRFIPVKEYNLALRDPIMGRLFFHQLYICSGILFIPNCCAIILERGLWFNSKGKRIHIFLHRDLYRLSTDIISGKDVKKLWGKETSDGR